MTTGKTIALTRQTFVGKVMSLLFNMLSRLVIKLSIQKTKIMASGPIISWQIDRETMKTVTDFILGGSKITADGDGSHEIKRLLFLGRKKGGFTLLIIIVWVIKVFEKSKLLMISLTVA